MGSNADGSTPWVERLASPAGPKTGPFKYDDDTFALPLLPTSTNIEARNPEGSYTLTARLNSLEDAQKRRQPPNYKLLQLLNNIRSVLRKHPSADFALGLAVHLDMAYAVKVDNEVVRIVELKDRWDDVNLPKMVALLRIFLNVDYDSSGFSNVFNCANTPDSGFNETAFKRVESLSPSTQQVLQGLDEQATDSFKVSPLKCIPPSVLAHSGSGTYAAFKLDTTTPPDMTPTDDNSSTSTPASPHLYQL
ncbi:BZ3501_MvSof-1269-A2-R1_Chr7-1g08791 [Microbotryum saponariae]|nr:BZ3501_MvSof-1269-A2-R1_Chr7-1g08791 [Microbotryum saponariae]